MFNMQISSQQFDFGGPVFSIMMAFALSTLVAFTYEKTFKGLSYSRNYIQALILSSIVAATVMQAIGDSLASGFGMMGALAIIRFRTSLKDPKDIIFMFASLASGIACGVRVYGVATAGTFAFCSAAVILNLTPFGETSFYDGMLRFNIAADVHTQAQLENILKKYCKVFALITLRDMAQGTRLDYAYHIKLKNAKDKPVFITELKTITDIRGVSLLLQETTVEI